MGVYQNSTMPNETSEPKPTEKKRAATVHDLKPKTDPKGGAGNGGKTMRGYSGTERYYVKFLFWLVRLLS